MAFKTKKSVQRVVEALKAAGLGDRVIEMQQTARTAQDAARAVDAQLGQIVKSLTFRIGDRDVLALVAGDHNCLPENLPRVLNLDGKVTKPQAQRVKDVTGFTIGGVAPVGLANDMPIAIDASLRRFEQLYAAAGHPHCLFPASFDELKRLTGGIVSYNIAEAVNPEAVEAPHFERTKTFLEKAEMEKAAAEKAEAETTDADATPSES